MARVLVIGRNGMLARALRRILALHGHAVRSIGQADHDVRRRGAGFDLSGVDAVVNAAGLINRRLCGERTVEDAYLVNSLFPRLLADHCQAAGVACIHISTDCVFDGTKGPRMESEPPDAIDLYGRTKALGEPANALVLRTSIIGPETHHGDSLLCWFFAQKMFCEGYDNHLWNGVTTLELGRIVSLLLDRKTQSSGIRHVIGETLTKRQILEAFKRAFGLKIEIRPTSKGPQRDMRLGSEFPAFLDSLAVRHLAEQLADIEPLIDARGFWRADVTP